MAYDEKKADRIRLALSQLRWLPDEHLAERKMFGGLCFTLNGKMLIGVERERVVVRLHDADLESALEQKRAEPMDFTGKPLRNFAYLPDHAYASDEALTEWIEKSRRFVREKMMGQGGRQANRKP
jgi:TfoX/Sxy family transcriptional regulator of competence genes